jgi:hypothetical protein
MDLDLLTRVDQLRTGMILQVRQSTMIDVEIPIAVCFSISILQTMVFPQLMLLDISDYW